MVVIVVLLAFFPAPILKFSLLFWSIVPHLGLFVDSQSHHVLFLSCLDTDSSNSATPRGGDRSECRVAYMIRLSSSRNVPPSARELLWCYPNSWSIQCEGMTSILSFACSTICYVRFMQNIYGIALFRFVTVSCVFIGFEHGMSKHHH